MGRNNNNSGNFLQVVANNLDVLALPLVTLVYPLYASIRAIETKSRTDDQQWLTYWVLYSLMTIFELTFAKPSGMDLCQVDIHMLVGAATIQWSCICLSTIHQTILYVPTNCSSDVGAGLFSKPDDVLTAAEKYMEEHGTDAFERLISKVDRERTSRKSNNYMIFDDDYIPQRNGPVERDIDQAITALKKGATLLKYGRRGKPKFCSFRLSNDEALLIWYSGKKEKHLKLGHVSTILPGQRTAIFQRYPQPEKEYQSFSLLYNDRSLNLICKDKNEAEVWLVGLKAIITRGNYRNWRSESRLEGTSIDSPHARTRRHSPSRTPFCIGDPGDTEGVPLENIHQSRLGQAFADIVSYTANPKSATQAESVSNALSSFGSNNQSESKQPKQERKPEVRDNRVFPVLNGPLHLGGFNLTKASTPLAGDSEKVISPSVPASKKASRYTSPVSGRSSQRGSSEKIILEDSKLINGSLSQEIIHLRTQVEDLTLKSQHLEAELQRTSKKLKEVSAIAADEAEKRKSAKEVMKSLTAQLKEMSERMPEGEISHCNTGSISHAISFRNQLSKEPSLSNIITSQTLSNGNSMDRILANGTKSPTGKSERVLQDEPGVYITLRSLPGGSNELVRVRFSRRHFTEEAAERWWAENGAKLCEQHNIKGAE
ncbi:hypothetical protein DVH24_007160 [Malus domestica]|uniref:BRX domain-containing protein n=1 Tax=Malus domestica TaxID=3750 RepID=A0A498HHV8_MALDO|nr:hypothetical protein DVH24_007160 [Malus domestica]